MSTTVLFFRNLLTPLLAVAGYDVTAVENPLEAFRLQEEGVEFDAIVSDIEMPGMNGFEFVTKLREGDTTWSKLPVFAMSSHATQRDLERGRQVGFTDYVAKFNREGLLTAPTRKLKRRPPGMSNVPAMMKQSSSGTSVMSTEEATKGMFVTMTVAGQSFGIPVLKVQDVLGPQRIAHVPLAPPEILGSLNLRGRIVTAIDVRTRLAMPARGDGEQSMSVVVEHEGELYSLVIDKVGEVMTLPASDYERTPSTLGSTGGKKFLMEFTVSKDPC